MHCAGCAAHKGPQWSGGPQRAAATFSLSEFLNEIIPNQHIRCTHLIFSISVKGGCMPSCWLQFGWSGCSPASRYVLRLEQALFVVYKLGQTRRPGDPDCRQIGRIHAALVARRRARAGCVYFCSRWQLIPIVGGSGSNITLKR